MEWADALDKTGSFSYNLDNRLTGRFVMGGMMSPRPDVSKERTHQILDAATNVFSRLGFHKASMDDIVEESGLSKGALYWYFKSKDDIIIAILDAIFDRELAGARALVDAPGTAHERLLQLIRLTVREIKGMKVFLPIAYEFYALAFRNKTVQKALRSYFDAYLTALEPVIEQGIASGEFRAVDAKQTAFAIGAIVEGTLLFWVIAPDAADLDQQTEAGMRLLLAGIGAGQETPAPRVVRVSMEETCHNLR
jgi:AcrR family transcriptional regulator